MDLVTIVEIELFRPRSVTDRGIGFPSDPKTGTFVVDNDDVETLRQQVLSFAEQCGIDRTALHGLQHVPGRNYTHDNRVVVFDITTFNVQYGQPYAACKADFALRIGNRFFKLTEIVGVSHVHE